MQQVLQHLQSGATQVRDIPIPMLADPGDVLIANEASLLSAGTEKMLVDFARKSLLGKVRSQPEQVRRVLQKMKKEGIFETLRQVRSKLAEPMALGYSAAGIVLEVGRDVRRFRPGDRVVSNGPHAGVVVVPENLVAKLPENVSFAEGCYGVVGAIALQGVRLARVGLGDRVLVVGLGLIGQLTVMLLHSAGCQVFGTDPEIDRRRWATETGALTGSPEEVTTLLREQTDGNGADAVLITASTSSNGPLELAADAARKKARIVAVGSVRLDVPRRAFYPKELELVVSCSYGPGRYDPDYEDRGHDYPYAYVRWTEQRNIEGFLELLGRKRFDVARLTTHSFSIDNAAKAYELMSGASNAYLGIVLTYPPVQTSQSKERQVQLVASKNARHLAGDRPAVSFIGAGNFASLVLLPLLGKLPNVRLRTICSAGGVRAVIRGEQHGFEIAATDIEDVLRDPQTQAVFVVTPHQQHSEQALAALRAGKHVFVEKPLAITRSQLDEFERGIAELGSNAPIWTVGFNRRFSPGARRLAEFFAEVKTPVTLLYRFNAGPLPPEHWAHDPAVGGGRLIGEACHAIDLARYLARSPIMRVFAMAVPPGGSASVEEDQAVLSLEFANGSVASIGYFAGGDKAFPKERIEIFGGGSVGVLDDFRHLTLCRSGRTQELKLKPGAKGHAEELAAFVTAICSGGSPPILYDELLNVSRASLAVVESLRTGVPIEIPS